MLIVFIFELLGIVKVDLFVLSILYVCVYVPLSKSINYNGCSVQTTSMTCLCFSSFSS